MEYNVKIDKVDTQNMSYDSSAECLEITLEEYKHVTERANKYDNKIYIMITFCSVFFAFILTLLDKLVTLSFPQTTRAGIIFVLCIVLFIIICLCYISKKCVKLCFPIFHSHRNMSSCLSCCIIKIHCHNLI